jgi:hypothetical protein
MAGVGILQPARRMDMKKTWLTLGLVLVLFTVGGPGFQIFGASPAFGQPPPYPGYGPPPNPPPPPYYNPYPPPPPYDYYNYYSAPQANPMAQTLFYVVPQVAGAIAGAIQQNNWQRQEQQYYRNWYGR